MSPREEQIELFPTMSALEELAAVDAELLGSESDEINRPDHYTAGGIETYDYIKSWEMSFAEGNVIKYVTRAPYKGTQVKDLQKARWYLDQLIEEAQRNGL